MGYQAVVFDFFGTLAVSTTRATRLAEATRVAAILGIPGDRFHSAVISTFPERATASFGDAAQTMRWLAQKCGYSPSAAQITEACDLRLRNEDIHIRALRDDAESTVHAVRDAGYQLGLISDCTHELPAIWPSLPIAQYFDATVFSVEVGIQKPHPDMYATLTQALAVDPSTCLYIGDGGSNELAGARLAGMTPVQLVTADAADAIVYDLDATWDGPAIRSLADVIGLLEAA